MIASGSACTSAGIPVDKSTQTEPVPWYSGSEVFCLQCVKQSQHVQSVGSQTDQLTVVDCSMQCGVPDPGISTPKHSTPKMEFVSPESYPSTHTSTSLVEDTSSDLYCPSQTSASSFSCDEEPTQPKFYMVSSSSLSKLMVHCLHCGGLVQERSDSHHGMMLRSKLTCENKCRITWESQPTVGQHQSLGKEISAC